MKQQAIWLKERMDKFYTKLANMDKEDLARDKANSATPVKPRLGLLSTPGFMFIHSLLSLNLSVDAKIIKLLYFRRILPAWMLQNVKPRKL